MIKGKKFRYSGIRTYAIIGVIILLCIFFGMTTKGSFVSARNISNLFRQMSIVGMLGAGAVFVIVAGHIDLSVGIETGFLGCLAAVLMARHGAGTGVTILITLALGLLLGLGQGFLIAQFGLPAFIVTLGAQIIFKGLIILVTNGQTITPLNPSFVLLGQGYLTRVAGWIIAAVAIVWIFVRLFMERKKRAAYGFENTGMMTDIAKRVIYAAVILIMIRILNQNNGIPVPVFIVFALVLILTWVAEQTVFGRCVYALGGNLEAVRYAGINVKKCVIAVFGLNGIVAGLAAVVLTARQGSGLPSSGTNMELDAIAAAVIGGTSMSGGVGRVFGAIIGAFLLATIDNGMSILNVDTSWQYIVKGGILIGAVLFDIRSKE